MTAVDIVAKALADFAVDVLASYDVATADCHTDPEFHEVCRESAVFLCAKLRALPTVQPEPAPALGASVSDWGTIPRSLYVVSAQTDGVVYTVTMCNVPYAMGPEVRYDLVAPITLHSDMRALVEAAQQTWEGLVGEYGYSKARVNFGGLEDALTKLKGGA